MDNNCLKIIELVIDSISRIIIPIIVPFIVYFLGRKPIKKLFDSRLGNIEKQLREHIRGYSDEDQELMDKTLKDVFSKPSMRW